MRSLLWIPLFLALHVGCGKPTPVGDDQPPAATTTAAAPTAGPPPQTVFTQRCVPCHGSTGSGDGIASASLNPKPRAFSDPTWQASVTDDHIEKIIKFGGAGVGKSPAMPNNPDLSDPAVITGLKDIVRSFKKK